LAELERITAPQGCSDVGPCGHDQRRAPLRPHAPRADVWAYGSRVSGSAHEASDLDIVLRNPQDLSRPIRAVSTLRQALSDSMLPIMVDVHDWAHLPEYFHEEILQAYVVLRQGDPRTVDDPQSLDTLAART